MFNCVHDSVPITRNLGNLAYSSDGTFEYYIETVVKVIPLIKF